MSSIFFYFDQIKLLDSVSVLLLTLCFRLFIKSNFSLKENHRKHTLSLIFATFSISGNVILFFSFEARYWRQQTLLLHVTFSIWRFEKKFTFHQQLTKIFWILHTNSSLDRYWMAFIIKKYCNELINRENVCNRNPVYY